MVQAYIDKSRRGSLILARPLCSTTPAKAMSVTIGRRSCVPQRPTLPADPPAAAGNLTSPTTPQQPWFRTPLRCRNCRRRSRGDPLADRRSRSHQWRRAVRRPAAPRRAPTATPHPISAHRRRHRYRRGPLVCGRTRRCILPQLSSFTRQDKPGDEAAIWVAQFWTDARYCRCASSNEALVRRIASGSPLPALVIAAPLFTPLVVPQAVSAAIDSTTTARAVFTALILISLQGPARPTARPANFRRHTPDV